MQSCLQSLQTSNWLKGPCLQTLRPSDWSEEPCIQTFCIGLRLLELMEQKDCSSFSCCLQTGVNN